MACPQLHPPPPVSSPDEDTMLYQAVLGTEASVPDDTGVPYLSFTARAHHSQPGSDLCQLFSVHQRAGVQRHHLSQVVVHTETAATKVQSFLVTSFLVSGFNRLPEMNRFSFHIQRPTVCMLFHSPCPCCLSDVYRDGDVRRVVQQFCIWHPSQVRTWCPAQYDVTSFFLAHCPFTCLELVSYSVTSEVRTWCPGVSSRECWRPGQRTAGRRRTPRQGLEYQPTHPADSPPGDTAQS